MSSRPSSVLQMPYKLLLVPLSLAISCAAYADTHPLPEGTKLANGQCDFMSKSCARTGYHTGTDLMAKAGTAVKSMCPGSIVYNNTDTSRGRNIMDAFLVIKHKCDRSEFYGYYGHIDSNLRIGQSVSEGQVLGRLKDWGSNSHLHMGLSKSKYSSGWGYRSSIGDYVNFETVLGVSTEKPEPVVRKPRAPRLRTTRQKTRNVGVFWDKNPDGTNYRVQIARVDTTWDADEGFSKTVVNATNVSPAGRYMGYAWRNAPAGEYQYTVRVNIDGVGFSKFAIPKTFTVD